MNNVTTFETSQRLKAAGFPQPVPEFGQVWYVPESEEQYICIKPANLLDRTFAFMKPNGCGNLFFAKEIVFAPTATDILRELGFEYSICYATYEFMITKEVKTSNIVFTRNPDNPAEAAALAYLSLHEKTEKNEL